MLDNLTNVGKILVLGGLALLLLSVGVGLLHPAAHQMNYEYQVKSEQIETDAGYNGTAVPIDDISAEEQTAIFDAYKKSDHFLGGASATIETDEPLNIQEDDRWRAVEIEGVRVLVGIAGPDRISRTTAIGGWTIVLMVSGGIISAIGNIFTDGSRRSRGY